MKGGDEKSIGIGGEILLQNEVMVNFANYN